MVHILLELPLPLALDDCLLLAVAPSLADLLFVAAAAVVVVAIHIQPVAVAVVPL